MNNNNEKEGENIACFMKQTKVKDGTHDKLILVKDRKNSKN